MLWRIYVVLAGIVLFAILIFGRAVKISIYEGEKWKALKEKSYVQYRAVEAERGSIFAQDGSLLAVSLPYYAIHLDLSDKVVSDENFNNTLDSLSYCLATYVDNSYTVGGWREKLIEARKKKNRYLLIKNKVPYNELEEIKKFPLFKLGQYKGGFIAEMKSERKRPYRLLAHRTIGYVREGIKPIGLEGAFDEELKGAEGKRLMQRVAGNTWIPVNDLTEIKAQSGNDIKTTIDVNIQDITEEALLKAVRKHDAEYGTAIVMEVKTGAIKAIANLGRHKEGWWETYNFAVGNQVEPGSTFKLASMMALMEDNKVDLEDTINLELGKTMFYEDEMRDASYHGLNETTARKAFEISSNVGISKLVVRGYDEDGGSRKFINRLKSMSLHLPTGIEIDGELPPFIKEAYSKEDKWSGTTLPWMSIGYELTMSPLQVLSFYNAVANNGKMMKPHLVSEIQRFDKTLEKFKPTIVNNRIASPKTIQKAKELLEGVVLNGTAKKLATKQYNFAGKTGTAQVDYKRMKKSKIKYQASFAGYFPAEKPIYSCIVLINGPKQHGFYGGEVAGPVFREIADKCYASQIEMQVPVNAKLRPILATRQLPTYDAGKKDEMKYILSYLKLPYGDNANKNWAVTAAAADTIALKTRKIEKDIIPSVRGMGLRDALYILESRKLQVETKGIGKVVSQSIKPGTKARGQRIVLTLD